MAIVTNTTTLLFEAFVEEPITSTSRATVTIAVQGVVDAVDDSFTVDSGDSVTFSLGDLLANDTANGVPATLENVTIEIVTQPANGTLVDNEDGTFTYTPNEGFCGPDPFDYEITNICTELPPEPTCVVISLTNNYADSEDSIESAPDDFVWGETPGFVLEKDGVDYTFEWNGSEYMVVGGNYVECMIEADEGWTITFDKDPEPISVCAIVSNGCS